MGQEPKEEDPYCMQAAPFNRLGPKQSKRGRESLSTHAHSVFLSGCIHCCCHHLWTLDSSFFSLSRWTQHQGASRPSALNWGCSIGLSCSEAFSFLDWAAASFSYSQAYRQPLWDSLVCVDMPQANKTFL
jgi:hypothetical protein